MANIKALILFGNLLIYIGCRSVVFAGESNNFSDFTDDEESGSGEEEDPMVLANTKKVAKVVDTMKKMHNTKTDQDLSESLKTGARQVMHSIASKLVSHTSNKITNHVGSIIKSSLVNRKSDVSSNLSKDKSLSSSTQVIIPALSVAKLSENGTTHATIPDNKSSSQRQEITVKPGSSVSNFVKAPPIGPMEKLTISINGHTSTFNNFTKLNKEPEVHKPSKLDVLKFEDGLASNSEGALRKYELSTRRKRKFATKKEKVKTTKKNKKKRRKSRKKSKKSKSKIHEFPKIILYQGPISKALESMLTARESSPLRQQHIDSPMSFEEATADIKRSNIPRVNKSDAHVFRDQDEEEEEDEYEDEDFRDTTKKSKVSKGQRKYTIKGYHDKENDASVKPDKKTLKSKKPKNESAKKKFSVSYNGKELKDNDENESKDGPVPILTINSSPNEANDDSKEQSLYPDLPKSLPRLNEAKKLKNYKPAIVPIDADTQSNQLNDFIKQMNIPISNSRSPGFQMMNEPFSTDFGFGDKTGDNNLNLKVGNHKANKVIENSPASSDAEKNHLTITPVGANKNQGGPYQKEGTFPNPAGYTTMGDVNALEDDDDDDEQGEEDKIGYDVPKFKNSSEPHVVEMPLQPKPQPVQDNPDTPAPVHNAPDFDPNKSQNQFPPPASSLPLPPAASLNPDLENELMERIEGNSEKEGSLANEIRDVESRLTELEGVVKDIGHDVELIEKRMDTQQHQQANQDFAKFAGSLPPLQENVQGPKLQHKIPFQFPVGFNHPPKRPHILKEIFIPLPPPHSAEAKQIENGAPLRGLPWPLNEIISKIMRDMFKYPPQLSEPPLGVQYHAPRPKQPWHHPRPLPDLPLPPREHDIDRLELELGRIPITRVGGQQIPQGLMKKPRILLFSKAPQIVDLREKPCDEPCENGGHCIGGNVCKCPHMFTGLKCERGIHRSDTPGDILDILGPSDSDIETAPRKSNLVSVPFVLSEGNGSDDNDDSANQKTMGQVDQSKLVDILSQFLPGIVKRSQIPSRRHWKYPVLQRRYTKKKK